MNKGYIKYKSHILTGEEKLHDHEYLTKVIEGLQGDSDDSWWIKQQLWALVEEIRGRCGVCEDEE